MSQCVFYQIKKKQFWTNNQRFIEKDYRQGKSGRDTVIIWGKEPFP